MATSGEAFPVKKGMLGRSRHIRVGANAASLEVVRRGELRAEWKFEDISRIILDRYHSDSIAVYFHLTGGAGYEILQMEREDAVSFFATFYEVFANWLTSITESPSGIWFPVYVGKHVPLDVFSWLLPRRLARDELTGEVYVIGAQYYSQKDSVRVHKMDAPTDPPPELQSMLVTGMREIPPSQHPAPQPQVDASETSLYVSGMWSPQVKASPVSQAVLEQAKAVLEFFGADAGENPICQLCCMARKGELSPERMEKSIYRAYFLKADKDGSGDLDKEELRACVSEIAAFLGDQELAAAAAPDVFDKFFQQTDKNQNGEISLDEFLLMMESIID
mmetsp:Transcript_8300/g.34829  ORF Transcript_8300/g.34829 Transcript_8300/m.34829 type:complete len:334 (-) Transcript_8300:79-1080(-)